MKLNVVASDLNYYTTKTRARFCRLRAQTILGNVGGPPKQIFHVRVSDMMDLLRVIMQCVSESSCF